MLLVCYPYVLVCTRMLPVCYSYVLVCYPYVLVCNRMSLVCHPCSVLVTIEVFHAKMHYGVPSPPNPWFVFEVHHLNSSFKLKFLYCYLISYVLHQGFRRILYLSFKFYIHDYHSVHSKLHAVYLAFEFHITNSTTFISQLDLRTSFPGNFNLLPRDFPLQWEKPWEQGSENLEPTIDLLGIW